MRVVQHRRGTTSSLSTILGAPGELFVDTSLVTVVVHDGVTTGGVTLATQSYAQSAAPVATSSILGKVRPDGTSVLITNGVISVGVTTTGTTSVAGILQVDNTSILVTSGVISVNTADTIYTITDSSTVSINPALGKYQLWTLGVSSRVPSAANFYNGQSVTLMISNPNNVNITWTTIGVVWTFSSIPTLYTTGMNIITLFKVNNVVYGANVGNAG
jgi:hypothetical protein